jgi:PAS domain S-box-containing protein
MDDTHMPADRRASQGRKAQARRNGSGVADGEHGYRQVLDALPGAIYATDAHGVVTFFNREAAALAGREPEIGKDKWCVTWRLYQPDGTPLPHDQCPMALALKEKRPVRGVMAIAERPDGTRVPFAPYPTPIFDQSGELVGGVNMLVDLSEQLQAAGRAERASAQLASIVESSDDAIVSKDLNGIVTSWNKGAERLFGYRADEMIGKSITLLFPPGHEDEEPRILGRIRHGERMEHYETVRRRKSGELVHVSLSVSPMRDSAGGIVGASKIARDITDRKRSEAALARHAAEQAALFELTDRLYRAASQGDVFDAALDAIILTLGCDRASILLFDEAETMKFVAWRGLSAEYRQAVEGHSPWPAGTNDPNPIYVDDVAAADFSASLKATVKAEGLGALAFIPLVAKGRLIGKFMAYYDGPHTFTVTDQRLSLTIARQLGFSLEQMRAEEARRRAEAAVREGERRLQLALQAGQMGAWEWTIGSGEVVWSPGLETIHGLAPGSFGGTIEAFRSDIHPEDLDRVLAEIGSALKTKNDYHVVYRINRPDGEVRWVEAFGSFAPGAPEKLAGVCMDITERRQAEAHRELLLAELSHRVKNTLATVMSIARQSFARHVDAASAPRLFESRIRALARTHSRLAETSWSGVSLEALFAGELAPYRREDGGNIRLSGPEIVLNPKCALTLGMAAHELTTNAAKHGALSTKEGTVEVSWTVDPANRSLAIAWKEQGGPPVGAPQHSGFGRLLLERAVAADLQGDVRMEFSSGGVRCHISVPVEKLPTDGELTPVNCSGRGRERFERSEPRTRLETCAH